MYRLAIASALRQQEATQSGMIMLNHALQPRRPEQVVKLFKVGKELRLSISVLTTLKR